MSTSGCGLVVMVYTVKDGCGVARAAPHLTGGGMRREMGLGISVALVLSLAACEEGEVTKRKCTGVGESRVCRVLVVNDDRTRERWVEVDDFAYDHCTKGTQYPECGSTGYDNPEERINRTDKEAPNPRRERPDRERQNLNSREMCVQATADPGRDVRVSWSLDAGHEEVERWYGKFGPRCRRVHPGKQVWISVEENNSRPGKRITLCSVWTRDRHGNRQVLDAEVHDDGQECYAGHPTPAL